MALCSVSVILASVDFSSQLPHSTYSAIFIDMHFFNSYFGFIQSWLSRIKQYLMKRVDLGANAPHLSE